MKLTIPFVMAMATASGVEAWSLGPSYYWPSPMLLVDTPLDTRRRQGTMGDIIKRQRDLANRMLEETNRLMQDSSTFHTSPRFDLIDNDEKFQVSLDVPGVKPENLSISLEKDGFITIRGERVATDEKSSFASKFFQTFSLDPSVDFESFRANLDNGVLVISASKDKSKIEEKVRKIPITSGMAVNNELHASAAEPVLKHASNEGEKTVEIATPQEENAEEVIDLDHEMATV